ncbi:MAG: Hsp70 family protein [Vicinamibacterales bacterium]
MSPTTTEPRPGRLAGIDLGTTNSALAWTDDRGAIRIFEVPQLSAPGELTRLPTLPSFLYLPTQAEQQAKAVALPWHPDPDVVVGIFARDAGALVPARQIASAKSWLANPSVDRNAGLLPWGVEEGPRLSPVEASSRILAYLREAWNQEGPAAGSAAPPRLETIPLVLTVPASFDEEARELTLQAAHRAGLTQVTLLEEPIAALYAWIAAHRRQLTGQLPDGGLVLVCDVGGGTTDFSLMRAAIAGDDLQFERVAIGEHLLLGGDNLDLALAALVEKKLTGAGAAKLSLTQRLALRRKCSAAKEALLSAAAADRVPITLLGSGRGVIGGGLTSELTREDTTAALLDGFLPLVEKTDVPARDRRLGLRELGLPYEPEPAITRHLAAFLARATRDDAAPGLLAAPTAVLFNGGFFTPALARTRVLDALESWFGSRPAVLENERPDAAVAIGAAYYARLRANPEAAKRLFIRAGSARAYYVALHTANAAPTAICVMPRGTDEGTTLALERTFDVTTNQPIAFTLYSSTQRHDRLDEIVAVTDQEAFHRHAPLVTVLRYGQRSRRVSLAVGLRIVFTETGTLELWCESRQSDHRWRLAFNLRAAEADPLEVTEAGDDPAGQADEAVVPAESLERALRLIERVFKADTADQSPPESLTSDLEALLGFGKQAWPLGTIRRLADALLAVASGRSRSAAHEARWLNLTGFCVRPGFGAAADAWRISELRTVYAGGLAFPKDVPCQAEWLVLWQRVGAGFTAGHQRELAQRVGGQLGVGQKKPLRVNPQIEREGWRLLASLERLDVGQRVKLGDELLTHLRRDPRNRSGLWAIGRFGARAPFYGPLSSTVPPTVAERWIDRLLTKGLTTDAAAAIVQIGARTNDPARDLSDGTRDRVSAALQSAGTPSDVLAPLAEVVVPQPLDLARAFGEALPEGLRLRQDA